MGTNGYFKGKYYYSEGKRYLRYHDDMTPEEVDKCKLISPTEAYELYKDVKWEKGVLKKGSTVIYDPSED